MISTAFDPNLLRTFVSVCAHGSMSRAAEEAGRAQSLLSTQMRRLEAMVGKPLLRRTGRGVVPTTEGELMLGYARRILSLTDEAAARLGERVVMGNIRIGLAEDLAVSTLPRALGQVRRAFPDLHLDITVNHGTALADIWNDGGLDIAVAGCSSFAADPVEVWDVPLHWVCGIDEEIDIASPLGVVVYAEPCPWRRLMFDALADAEREFRVVLTSHNVGAIVAAVENGLGIALLTAESIKPQTMRVLQLTPDGRLVPSVKYGLYASQRRNATITTVTKLLHQSIDALTKQRAVGSQN